jgi:hypothetical protein
LGGVRRSAALYLPFVLMLERMKFVARERPALPRCADRKSGDKMIDRVLPREMWFCGRSVFRGCPAEDAGSRLRSGADRKPSS